MRLSCIPLQIREQYWYNIPSSNGEMIILVTGIYTALTEKALRTRIVESLKAINRTIKAVLAAYNLTTSNPSFNPH